MVAAKRRKMLSERAAWLDVARRINEGLAYICWAIDKSFGRKVDPRYPAERMCKRMAKHRPFGIVPREPWWPFTKSGHCARAAFCRKMAALCAEEEGKRKSGKR